MHDKTLKMNKIQSLTNFAENLTNLYIDNTSQEYRKERGQYFTPKLTSDFMVRQLQNLTKKESTKILDPGAGTGIFESAVCDFLLTQKTRSRVFFDLYEIDRNIIQLLKKNMKMCQKVMINNGFEITYKIHNKDFILSNAHFLNNLTYFDHDSDGYDFIISNPPYFKLKKESPQATKMSSIVKGQPNIYALFMALSAQLLKNDGQMTVITPRSYCSGAYFKVFRKWFFKYMKPIKIHVFESRKEIFKKYNVLQEMLILTAVKSFEAPEKIQVTTSVGETVEIDNLVKRNSAYQNIITEDNDDIIIRIPLFELDEHIIAEFDKLNFNLNTLGFKVSTGPVVPFRAKDYLLSDIRGLQNRVPLIWMQNIINGKIVWPIPIKDKNIAIVSDESSQKLLIPKGNYVLVKRLSSKEGKQRISAGVLLKKNLNSDFIGIENHLNYIHKANDVFTEHEAYGIAALLNSKLYNKYFQTMNGNTQVNATEIMNLPMPSLEIIKKVGRLIKKDEENNEIKNEAIITNELNINEKIIAALVDVRKTDKG